MLSVVKNILLREKLPWPHYKKKPVLQLRRNKGELEGSYLESLQGVFVGGGEHSVGHFVKVWRFSSVHEPQHFLHNFVVHIRDIHPISLLRKQHKT